jgi:hypothetical protein
MVVTVTARDTHLQRAVSVVGTAVSDALSGAPARVQLAASGNAISGVIRAGEREWHLQSDADGSRLQELAAAGIVTLPNHSESVFNAISEGRGITRVKAAPLSGQAPALKIATASSVSTLDVEFVSDLSFQQRMGGESQELADLAYIVTAANTAYADSGAYVRLRMVNYRRALFDASSMTMLQAIVDMETFAGTFDGTWPLRVASGADVQIGVTARAAVSGRLASFIQRVSFQANAPTSRYRLCAARTALRFAVTTPWPMKWATSWVLNMTAPTPAQRARSATAMATVCRACLVTS